MGKRRIVKGKAYAARERSTSKGKKGTLMGKWSPKSKKQKSERTLKESYTAVIARVMGRHLSKLYLTSFRWQSITVCVFAPLKSASS